MSHERAESERGSRSAEGRRPPRSSGDDGDLEESAGYRRARELFRTLEREGHLDGVVRRSKRFAAGGLAVALVAYGVAPGGVSGVILDVWGLVAFGFAVLGLLVWLAASAFRADELDAPKTVEGGVSVDLETVGAPLLVSLADRTHTSAGVRLLWSLLLGEATLPAASAVASETDTIAEADVRRLRRSLRRAAWASVAVVAVDLTLRVVTVETVLGLLSGGVTTGGSPSVPTLAGLADLLALPPAAWLAVFAAVLVGGGLVGLLLAVSRKT